MGTKADSSLTAESHGYQRPWRESKNHVICNVHRLVTPFLTESMEMLPCFVQALLLGLRYDVWVVSLVSCT